ACVLAGGLLKTAPVSASAKASFAAAANFSVGSQPGGVAVADFNGDGKPDFVTPSNLTNNITVRLGNGAGGFGPATNFAVAAEPQAVAIGDFNRDGNVDIVI